MAYTKTVWVDNQSPDINATNLNHIEQGIYDAHAEVNTKITMPDDGTTGQVLTKTSNGVEWASSGGGAVDSVNGQTGVVVLTASDVGALPDTTVIPTVPTDVSAFNNDAGYLTSAVTSFNGNTGAVTYTAPVSSVNGQTGAVVLTASDVGASPVITVENKTSSDTVVTLTADTFYVFPTMTSLAVTVTSVGMYLFRFQSGSTATSLTVTGATMPDSFTVEANKVYEVNIYNGYGVVNSWTAF